MKSPALVEAGVAVTASLLINGIRPVAWLGIGILFVCFFILVTIDLIMCYNDHDEFMSGEFDWKAAIFDRLVISSVIPISLIGDATIYTLMNFMPSEYVVLGGGWLICTAFSLLWLNGAYTARILKHVKLRGADFVPPHIAAISIQIRKFISVVRVIDQKRYVESGHVGPPPSRWQDQISDKQLSAILAILASKPESQIPSDPGKLAEGLEALIAREIEDRK